jgi:hypothetical protein
MLSIPNISNINNYRDLSYKQIGELKQLSSHFSQPGYDVVNESEDNQQSIYGLKDRIIIIDRSLKQKRTFRRWFLDLITLQFVKRIMLTHALPLIKNTIQTLANEVFEDSLDFDSPLDDKLELTQRAYTVFCAKRDDQAAKETDENWVSTAIEVNDFFQDMISRLKAGEDRPLPLWFHATGKQSNPETVSLIAENSVLKQNNAYMGKGVYFSTQDEHYNNYGDYTYSIDPNIIYDKNAAYFEGTSRQRPAEESPYDHRYNAVWVRVENDVKISGATVAYIAAPDEETRDDLKSKFWGAGDNWNDPTKFYAEVITRKASDWIRQSFRATGYIYRLPSNWRRHHTGPRITILCYVREP